MRSRNPLDPMREQGREAIARRKEIKEMQKSLNGVKWGDSD